MGKQPGNNRIAIAQLLPCLQKSRGTHTKIRKQELLEEALKSKQNKAESIDVISSNSVFLYSALLSASIKSQFLILQLPNLITIAHMLTMARVLDDILFISVAKGKFN